ncbi:hypothetical protein MNB_SV-12-1042 [hydrothermal vent metagenome]|uniref:Uncharacterized protein n=1 Tax=hydrothermal vent metagenome TaxID=652676 RepID=A0A1W1CEC7_9ZZZZ
MEHTISYIYIIIVPIITIILYLLSKGLFIISTIAGSLLILFILYIYHNLERKETLNIIKSDGRLYFNLSDDQLFSVKISSEQSLSEVIKDAILNEMATLKDMVGNIDFINFKDDRLHRELNRLVQN